jgi:hypothetical protein
MKNIFSLFILFVSAIGCNNNKEKEKINAEYNESEQGKIETGYKENLRFEDFKNTKWIVGEVGLNGESPDTIIFDKPEQLIYISDDTGREVCKYYFSEDTLIYVSYLEEFDMKSDTEINCKSINKLFFRGDIFKYIYIERKCSNGTMTERINVERNNIFFKRVKN